MRVKKRGFVDKEIKDKWLNICFKGKVSTRMAAGEQREIFKIQDRRVLAEQAGCDLVDALVGALRRQNGGDQQLPRITVMQGARGRRVEFVEGSENPGDARLAPGRCFGPRNPLRRFHRIHLEAP